MSQHSADHPCDPFCDACGMLVGDQRVEKAKVAARNEAYEQAATLVSEALATARHLGDPDLVRLSRRIRDLVSLCAECHHPGCEGTHARNDAQPGGGLVAPDGAPLGTRVTSAAGRSLDLDSLLRADAGAAAMREALENVRVNLVPPFMVHEDEWVSRHNGIIDAALNTGAGRKLQEEMTALRVRADAAIRERDQALLREENTVGIMNSEVAAVQARADAADKRIAEMVIAADGDAERISALTIRAESAEAGMAALRQLLKCDECGKPATCYGVTEGRDIAVDVLLCDACVHLSLGHRQPLADAGKHLAEEQAAVKRDAVKLLDKTLEATRQRDAAICERDAARDLAQRYVNAFRDGQLHRNEKQHQPEPYTWRMWCLGDGLERTHERAAKAEDELERRKTTAFETLARVVKARDEARADVATLTSWYERKNAEIDRLTAELKETRGRESRLLERVVELEDRRIDAGAASTIGAGGRASYDAFAAAIINVTMRTWDYLPQGEQHAWNMAAAAAAMEALRYIDGWIDNKCAVYPTMLPAARGILADMRVHIRAALARLERGERLEATTPVGDE